MSRVLIETTVADYFPPMEQSYYSSFWLGDRSCWLEPRGAREVRNPQF